MSGDTADTLFDFHELKLRSESYGDLTSEVSSYSRRSSLYSHFTRSKAGPFLEGNLRLFDIIECKPRDRELSSDVMCCRFNSDGSHLAIGLCDGTIKVYNPLTCQQMYLLQDEDTNKSRLPVTQIRFRPYMEGEKTEYSHIIIASSYISSPVPGSADYNVTRYMLSDASGHVKFWHYTSSKCLHTMAEGRQTLALTVNPEGTHILTAGSDSQIHMYDIETRQRINTLEPSDSHDVMDGHRFRVFALQYNPNHSHVFISGGWDDTVQYWDDRKVHSIKKFIGPHLCGDALDIDPVHNHILTGSWRKTHVLQIWDFATANKIKDVPQDTTNQSQLYCAQWLGKDSIICGGTNQNIARIIDRGTLNTTGQLVDLPQGVYCIDTDKHESSPRVAVGSNRYVYLLKADKRI